MRTVFTNSMCAHVWAQLSQPHGRSGSMKFDGAVAYSYSTAVANIITPQGRRAVMLHLPNRWGVTTGQHLRHYQDAARHLPQFEVPQLFTYAAPIRDAAPDATLHNENVAALTANYQKERDALLRVPADSWRVRALATEDRDGRELPRDPADDSNVSAAHVTLCRLAGVLRDYAEAFGIVCDALPWQTDGDKIVARRDRILNDPKRAAKQAAAAEARERAAAKRKAAAIEALRVAQLDAHERVGRWLAGEDVRLQYGDVPRERGALLRVKGESVQTSQGADAPVSHVRPALAFWLRTTRDRLTYERDPAMASVRLGHFRLDSIDADGNVRAGCHYITAATVRALVETLQATTSSDAA